MWAEEVNRLFERDDCADGGVQEPLERNPDQHQQPELSDDDFDLLPSLADSDSDDGVDAMRPLVACGQPAAEVVSATTRPPAPLRSAFDVEEANWCQQDYDDPWSDNVVVPSFIAKKKYVGHKAYMVFKTGPLGCGYYLDTGSPPDTPLRRPDAYGACCPR